MEYEDTPEDTSDVELPEGWQETTGKEDVITWTCRQGDSVMTVSWGRGMGRLILAPYGQWPDAIMAYDFTAVNDDNPREALRAYAIHVNDVTLYEIDG